MISKYNISFYSNIFKTKEGVIITFESFLNDVKNERFKPEIDKLRKYLTDGNQAMYKAEKKKLAAITPSGTFTERKEIGLISHSEILSIDFDGLESPVQAKAEIIKEPFVMAAFISPSNNGLKVFIKIVPDQHKEAFVSLQQHFKSSYKIDNDKGCFDVSRLCFVSSDKDVFINLKSEVYSFWPIAQKNELLKKQDQGPGTNKSKPQSLGVDKQNEVEKLISEIEASKTDITGDYNQWLNLGFAIASEFGISGEDYFYRISVFSLSYDYIICKDQYKKCCNSKKAGIGINTLFAIAKNYNVLVYDGIKKPKNKSTGVTAAIDKSNYKPKENAFVSARNFITNNYKLRYNEVSNKIQNFESNKWNELNENNVICNLWENNYNISQAKIGAILRSNYVPVHNPFTDYFNSLGNYDALKEPDYIKLLCIYITATDNKRFYEMFVKHLVRCVACALVDSMYNKQAFILVHDAQNSGKTTFIRWLCPPALNTYLGENIDFNNKDGEIALSEKFIINLDELASLTKFDINRTKSILSKDKVSVRRPFEKSVSDTPRRCSFFGSTNKKEFLIDETGSVRWLCFEIEKINWDYKIDIDINNIWKQANQLFKQGFKYDLTADEIMQNEKVNNDFFISTPEEDLINKYYLQGTPTKNDAFYTSSDFVEQLSIKTSGTIKIQPVTMGKILAKLGFVKTSKRRDLGNPLQGYYINFI